MQNAEFIQDQVEVASSEAVLPTDSSLLQAARGEALHSTVFLESIEVRAFLNNFGRDENGQARVGEVFVLIGRLSNGECRQYNERFPTFKRSALLESELPVFHMEDGSILYKDAQGAKASAENLRNFLMVEVPKPFAQRSPAWVVVSDALIDAVSGYEAALDECRASQYEASQEVLGEDYRDVNYRPVGSTLKMSL
jgi:hypothetical protein